MCFQSFLTDSYYGIMNLYSSNEKSCSFKHVDAQVIQTEDQTLSIQSIF